MHAMLASLADWNLLNFGHFVSKGLSFYAAFASTGLAPSYLVYPEGWALDAEGQPTTDAAKALKGTMVALGGPKGTALALMVEVLAAALTGAHLAFEASSFLDDKGPPPGTGQTIIVIDPAGFGHGAFGERITTLAGAIEAQAGARLPGQRRLALRQKALAEGIALPADLVAKYGSA